MASDDSAGASRRCAGGPHYRALRMRAEPQLLNIMSGALSTTTSAPASLLPVTLEQHLAQNLESVLPVAPAAPSPLPTLRWECPDQAPIARAMGNGPMGRLVVGHLREVVGVNCITIVCSCHGAPFSLTGFLEHAGAADLSYPLKRIMIYYPNLSGAGPSRVVDNGGGRGQE